MQEKQPQRETKMMNKLAAYGFKRKIGNTYVTKYVVYRGRYYSCSLWVVFWRSENCGDLSRMFKQWSLVENENDRGLEVFCFHIILILSYRRQEDRSSGDSYGSETAYSIRDIGKWHGFIYRLAQTTG
jgi:hypothetical protein